MVNMLDYYKIKKVFQDKFNKLEIEMLEYFKNADTEGLVMLNKKYDSLLQEYSKLGEKLNR